MAAKGKQDDARDAAPAPRPASAGRRLEGVDPGDAVPPGVAPVEPVPLTEEDRRVKAKLETLPRRS